MSTVQRKQRNLFRRYARECSSTKFGTTVKGNSVTPQHVKIVKEDYKKLIETAQRVYAEMERLQQENQKLRLLLNKNLGKEGKAVTHDTEQSSTASTIVTSDSHTNVEDLKSDCSKQ